MADSTPVDVTDDLDAFSDLLFNPKTESIDAEPEVEVEVDEDDETPETPSATEGDDVPVEESTDEESDQDDAPADEDEDEEVEEEEKPSKPHGRKSARERINELTAKARDAERRADALLRELEASRQDREKEKDKAVTPRQDVQPDPGAPGPDDALEDGTLKYPLGEFDPLFIRDLTRFTIKQESEAARKEAEEARQKTERETAEQELLSSWNDKLKAASERIPDLADRALELEDTFKGIDQNYGQYLASTIMSLDYGPDVLNYLAENLDEARKIVAAGPTRATIALGRIEAKFSMAEDSDKEVEKGKVIKQTSAPPPPPRTKGNTGKQIVAPDTDDLDAFEKQFFAPTRKR